MPDPERAITPSTQANIETIARLEQEFLERRSLAERMGNAIGGFAGSMTFFLLHIVWFIVWALVNTRRVPGAPVFDPYPFAFLTMVVSLEGVLIATFVLIKQNQMSRRADQRNHLNLQISLLAEKEITKILELQRKLCEHFGLKEAVQDEEVQELSRNTAVESLAREIEQQLPED